MNESTFGNLVLTRLKKVLGYFNSSREYPGPNHSNDIFSKPKSYMHVLVGVAGFTKYWGSTHLNLV
jgi:hypothetical protein